MGSTIGTYIHRKNPKIVQRPPWILHRIQHGYFEIILGFFDQTITRLYFKFELLSRN